MNGSLDKPIRLAALFRERPWGRRSLAPYFPDVPRPGGGPIGEAWFTFEENQTSLGMPLGDLIEAHPEILGTARDPRHPRACPLLLKLLFTTERLSVQVHPDDEYAAAHHGSLGKTEAWYVVDAEPGADIAVGFREPITPERFLEAVQTGEIEHLLNWQKVKAGDTIYTPAGTVHAIGAGVTVCEIQENSDITYRLYDYGRPRELHLEHGARVSRLVPHREQAHTIRLAEWRDQLVESSYFRIERLRPRGGFHIAGGLPQYLVLTCLRGSGSWGAARFQAGECWMIPAGNAPVAVEGDGEWILSYTAERPSDALTA